MSSSLSDDIGRAACNHFGQQQADEYEIALIGHIPGLGIVIVTASQGVDWGVFYLALVRGYPLA